MKKSKIFTSLILSFVFLICFSISAYAASANVYLDPSESSDVSSAIGLSNYSEYSALNDAGSLFGVYAIVQRAYPGDGWEVVEETLMEAPGISNGDNYASEDASWRLELNPYGWGFIGCQASGKIWFD